MKKNSRYRTIFTTVIVLLLVILLFVTAFIVPLTQTIEGTPDTNISNVIVSEDNIIKDEITVKTKNSIEYNELLDKHIKLKYDKTKILYKQDISENITDITEEEINTDIENTKEPTKNTEDTEKTQNTEAKQNNVLYATSDLNFDTTGWASLEMKITAYCPCAKCNGSYVGQPTASGTPLVVGRTIAVDPKVIPLGSYVVIDGHTYVAEDTGSGIKGNRIDLLFATHDEANEWGVRTRTVLVSQTRDNLTEYINNLNNPTNVEITTPDIEENKTEISENITDTTDNIENDTENIDTTENVNISENTETNEPIENANITENIEETESETETNITENIEETNTAETNNETNN